MLTNIISLPPGRVNRGTRYTSLGLRRCVGVCLFFLKGDCMVKKLIGYFTKFELILWGASVLMIVSSFLIFDRNSYFVLTASLIGVTSLIFIAKGNPFGQFLMIVFCLFYGVISFSFSYYGEMITYLGMSGPMAVFSMIAWLRNPYQENKAEVKVNTLSRREIAFMSVLTVAVTVILKAFSTANLFVSTISVTTSFLAVYLSFRRSPFFAFAYAANDIVLIILWILAAMTNISYLSVIICFVVFLANDIYGFVNWTKMHKRQINN